jgi:ABC-type multidrug transport system fused ATPase/permease subunit
VRTRLPVRGARSGETETCAPNEAGWRIAVGLLRTRKKIQLCFLCLGRIAVGLTDLLVAAAMYLLFLLLQGRAPAHTWSWLPTTILSVAIVTSVLVVVRAVVDIYSSRLVFDSIQGLYNEFLLRLTKGYGEMHWLRFAQRNRSELSNHALNTAREAADFYHRCIELTASIVIIVVMICALVYQSPMSALGFVCALAMFYAIHRLFLRAKIQQAASSRELRLGELHRSFAEMLAAGRETRTYLNHGFMHDRIRRQAEDVAVSNRRAVFLPQVARIIADQGTVLLFLLLIVAVKLRQGDPRELLSLLAFYFVLSRRLLPLMSQVSLIAGQMESSYENVRIVAAELKECAEHAAIQVSAPPPTHGMVMELRNVSFWFQDGVPILRDVNLGMRSGETIVLRGGSGIGKSSLMDLIAGVLSPESGAVHVDRRSIAYVAQDIPLLDDSIRNNLLFGLPEKSDQDLKKALALARLDEFIALLPEGLDTGVGDNGILLSGGERQRLGLARAILRRAELLLLDEATSALDEENERRVLENLSASGRAILFVTHRLHSYTFPHRAFRLQGSCLVEEGRTENPDAPGSVDASLEPQGARC